jgi:hypothetical protein
MLLYSNCNSRSAKRRLRRGVVAPMVAISLVALLSVAALVLDLGFMQDRKRHLQSAADAAALAAAIDLFVNDPTNSGTDPTGTAKASAIYIASSNGYTANGQTTLVTVNIPPKSGLFVGQDGYAEVILQYSEPRRFSRLFGTGNLPIEARAVARGGYRSFGDGIIILDLHKTRSFWAHGNGNANVIGAAVVVNSDAAGDAGSTNGGPAVFFADKGYNITGGEEGHFTGGQVNTGTAPIPDPLRLLPTPDAATLGLSAQTQSGSPLNPGVYSGLDFTGGTTVLNPGVYIVNGDVRMAGQAIVSGTGVVIYFTGSWSTTGSWKGSINLTAPSSMIPNEPANAAAYYGITLFQDRSSTSDIKIAGNGSVTLDGTMYAANADVMITGNGTETVNGQWISRNLDMGGNGDLNINYNAANGPKVRRIQLVE